MLFTAKIVQYLVVTFQGNKEENNEELKQLEETEKGRSLIVFGQSVSVKFNLKNNTFEFYSTLNCEKDKNTSDVKAITRCPLQYMQQQMHDKLKDFLKESFKTQLENQATTYKKLAKKSVQNEVEAFLASGKFEKFKNDCVNILVDFFENQKYIVEQANKAIGDINSKKKTEDKIFSRMYSTEADKMGIDIECDKFRNFSTIFPTIKLKRDVSGLEFCFAIKKNEDDIKNQFTNWLLNSPDVDNPNFDSLCFYSLCSFSNLNFSLPSQDAYEKYLQQKHEEATSKTQEKKQPANDQDRSHNNIQEQKLKLLFVTLFCLLVVLFQENNKEKNLEEVDL